MKIGVVCDLHLPDDGAVVQWDVLSQALAACVSGGADVVALCGDMIQNGAVAACRRLNEMLSAVPLPVVAALGNCEQATPEFAALVKYDAGFTAGGVQLCTLQADESRDSSASVRVLLDHWPQEELAPEFTLQIAGHLHRDIDSGRVQVVRGLDPDKVIGAPPCVTFFDVAEDGSWQHSESIIPGFSVDELTPEERRQLLSQIGISVKYNDLRSELHRAAAAGIRNVEIICTQLQEPEPIQEFIREHDGRISVHLAEINFENYQFSVDTVKQGAAAGVSRFTMHVPCVSVEEMSNPESFRRMAEIYSRIIQGAPDAIFGIENMHMTAGETAEKRRFGYLPGEQLAFINAVRQLTPGITVGAVLDIGHSRNNAPFSANNSISQWYKALEKDVVTMHIHQVLPDGSGGFRNHTTIKGWHCPLISLGSFLHQWRRTHFNDAAILIECREDWEESYSMFRNSLAASAPSGSKP